MIGIQNSIIYLITIAIPANNKIEEILVNWYFEEGDEDSVETAEIYEESLLRTDFRYIELAEAA